MKGKVKSDGTGLEEALIANPLYDEVFKYMMEDNSAARKFISGIIGEEVIKLSFAPQEYVYKKDDNVPGKTWSVYRLDFTARIRTKEGSKAVMIEVQKVSLNSDIIRFRSYLGGQYRNKGNSYTDANKKIHAIPIYCIFVVGDGIGIKGVPVITVNPTASDAATAQELKWAGNEFISGLHHHSWIVQVPELKGRRSNDMEMLLSIFDQTNRIMSDHHILNFREEHFPEAYRPVIRRLQHAVANKEIRNAMEMEDYAIGQMRMERETGKAEGKAEADAEYKTIISKKDAALSEKDAIIARERAEKEDAIARERAEKEDAIARERAEKDAAIAREENLRAEIAALKANLKTDK
ncbi:MAG: hypothetical protein LBK96_01330 [Prevotellaceae bacterium]|jgi:hypothetical protein|nr:hypothetical protein [Prevotellaceae bacterium]